MNLDLEKEVCESNIIMSRAIDFGIFLRNRGITGENISDFPDLKKEFDEISAEGRRVLETYGSVPVVLGTLRVLARDPIKFIISHRYMQNKVVPYFS